MVFCHVIGIVIISFSDHLFSCEGRQLYTESVICTICVAKIGCSHGRNDSVGKVCENKLFVGHEFLKYTGIALYKQ